MAPLQTPPPLSEAQPKAVAAAEKIQVVLNDPKSVILNLPQIEHGRYTGQYRVMSVDGHVIESSFDFSVKNKM